MTPKAQELIKIVYMVDKCIASGMTPFQAMSCSLEDEDWVLAYVAFKTLVKEAAEA